MSERPQEIRADGQEDLLEQIITQGLDKLNAPSAQAEAGPEAQADETPPVPKQEDGGKTATPEGSKNRRSAVYLYLLILFGAAFLMLLLAYFVQQRSNETTISDLRESMTLSREELLAEIKELKEQNDALNEDLDRLNNELDQWQERYEKKDGDAAYFFDEAYDAHIELAAWRNFGVLEEFYLAGDYESCAAVLILQEQSSEIVDRTPGRVWAYERYEEIVQAVIGAGILDEDYEQHPENYSDLMDAFYNKFGAFTTFPQWAPYG